MKIKSFEDTDTALLEFGGGTPAETRELLEDIYLGLDESGHVVSNTVEHASIRGDLSEFSFKRINKVDEVVEPTRLSARLTTDVGLRSPPGEPKSPVAGAARRRQDHPHATGHHLSWRGWFLGCGVSQLAGLHFPGGDPRGCDQQHP